MKFSPNHIKTRMINSQRNAKFYTRAVSAVMLVVEHCRKVMGPELIARLDYLLYESQMDDTTRDEAMWLIAPYADSLQLSDPKIKAELHEAVHHITVTPA